MSVPTYCSCVIYTDGLNSQLPPPSFSKQDLQAVLTAFNKRHVGIECIHIINLDSRIAINGSITPSRDSPLYDIYGTRSGIGPVIAVVNDPNLSSEAIANISKGLQTVNISGCSVRILNTIHTGNWQNTLVDACRSLQYEGDPVPQSKPLGRGPPIEDDDSLNHRNGGAIGSGPYANARNVPPYERSRNRNKSIKNIRKEYPQRLMVRYELQKMFFLEHKGFMTLDRILGNGNSHIVYILQKADGAVNLRLKGYPNDTAPVYDRLCIELEGDADQLYVASDHVSDLLKSICQQAVDVARNQSILVPSTLGFVEHRYTPGRNGSWVYQEERVVSQSWLAKLTSHEIYAEGKEC